MSEAVVYLRVSTQKQADSGLGTEGQEIACRKHCERMGWPIAAVFKDEATSGAEEVTKRPGLMALIAYTKAHPGTVTVVYKLKRLARRQRIMWELLDERGRYGLEVSSATEPFDNTTPMGRAMIGMLGVFAQLEWDDISDQNRAAFAAARARGIRLGGPRMYERGKGRVPVPELVQKVRSVADLYATGQFTHRTLAAHLNDTGVASPRGKRWHVMSVQKALRQAGEVG